MVYLVSKVTILYMVYLVSTVTILYMVFWSLW